MELILSGTGKIPQESRDLVIVTEYSEKHKKAVLKYVYIVDIWYGLFRGIIDFEGLDLIESSKNPIEVTLEMERGFFSESYPTYSITLSSD
jgi:hypothetical protein